MHGLLLRVNVQKSALKEPFYIKNGIVVRIEVEVAPVRQKF